MKILLNVSSGGPTRFAATLAQQIRYAAKEACVRCAEEARPAVIAAIKKEFHVRGTWYERDSPYGIHVRFDPNNTRDLSATVETKADWLAAHEIGADRVPEKEVHHGNSDNPHLTYAHAARPGIDEIVPTENKAWRILPDSRSFALKGGTVTFTRRRGNRLPNPNEVPFFINNAGTAIFKRLSGRRLQLFYTLPSVVHIKKNSTVFDPTYKV